MASPKVELVCDPIVLGEAPHWDHPTQMLYYVDIPSATVHRYVPATKKQTTAKVEGGPVSLILPVAGKKDQFVISQGRDLSLMTWDGESKTPSKVTPFLSVDHAKVDNRINDGKTDSTGRLWAGTMGPEVGPGQFKEEQGCLFSLNADNKTVTTHVTGLTIANGLAWSSDDKTMYYIDSITHMVEAFDFDVNKGTVSNRRTIFDLKKNKLEGMPDGMTIDTDGKLWVACFSGSQILRIDPTSGELLTRVPIPALQVTSLAFGGATLDELYVTTANIRQTEEQMSKYPKAGGVFKITGLGVKGLPGIPVKM